MSRKEKNIIRTSVSAIILICILIYGFVSKNGEQEKGQENTVIENTTIATSEAVASSTENNEAISLSNIPEYTGTPYVEINNNTPNFTEEDYTTEPFEKYSKLDSKYRCGVAYANICKEVMPPENVERESISSVKPTGWKQKKVNGEYVYNRCHLIGYQLAGENANKENLITGTRYFNVEGMLPFENKVADYIKENPNNHVLYRVTPIFNGENELASGAQMEAWSVEDSGAGVQFNVYVYNVQPGVEIDYATGQIK